MDHDLGFKLLKDLFKMIKIPDISDNGIILTGGTSLLLGIDKLIEKETGIKTKQTKDPLNHTINGVLDIVKNLDLLSEGYEFQTIHQLIS